MPPPPPCVAPVKTLAPQATSTPGLAPASLSEWPEGSCHRTDYAELTLVGQDGLLRDPRREACPGRKCWPPARLLAILAAPHCHGRRQLLEARASCSRLPTSERLAWSVWVGPVPPGEAGLPLGSPRSSLAHLVLVAVLLLLSLAPRLPTRV